MKLAPDQMPLAAAADHLAQALASCRRVVVLSGAGLSTASGIGDYRDAQGVYKRPPPITISRFLASHGARQRYWARSLFGWPSFNAALPNAGHRALAELQRACRNRDGSNFSVITQNVDELHQDAGHVNSWTRTSQGSTCRPASVVGGS